ncbi:MAG TPA: hypothetical protein VJN18_15445 [Polyangiaceae bacterium]|nr:hypothetical protein [Polyangiaceae bacterium]
MIDQQSYFKLNCRHAARAWLTARTWLTWWYAALGCLWATGLRAEPAPVPAETNPAAQGVERRISGQRVGDPFAVGTLGIEYGALLPGGKVPLPLADGGFARASRPYLSQLALQIGAIHFFGHADLFVNIPLIAFKSNAEADGESRQLKASYLAATGFRLYPWALTPGSLRPFVISSVMLRRLKYEDGVSARKNPGLDKRFVLPVGVGLSLRLPLAIVDAQVEYTFFDFHDVRAGQQVTALPSSEPAAPKQRLDLRGLRLSLGVKAAFDVSSDIVARDFRERESAALAKRIRDGSASSITIGLGPSTRLAGADSPYFDRRPYLRAAYDSAIFPHLSVGYYNYPLDAELRLAYRYIWGKGEAFGATLDARQHGVFLEALKLFEIGLYGFVPFVGLGVGYGQFDVSDEIPGERRARSKGRPVFSVPVGWDIRIKPSAWWLLRTNLRFIPRARVTVVEGQDFDFGGLEFDFIQLLLYPERL